MTNKTFEEALELKRKIANYQKIIDFISKNKNTDQVKLGGFKDKKNYNTLYVDECIREEFLVDIYQAVQKNSKLL